MLERVRIEFSQHLDMLELDDGLAQDRSYARHACFDVLRYKRGANP